MSRYRGRGRGRRGGRRGGRRVSLSPRAGARSSRKVLVQRGGIRL